MPSQFFTNRFVLIWMVLAALALSSAAAISQATETIYYQRPESTQDKRSEYPIKLLELALQKSGQAYQAGPSPIPMQQGRALQEIGKNSRWLDIMWTMTNSAREQQALPIRIPIDKGLLGWRLAIVTRQNRELLHNAKTANDLHSFKAVLGHDWPDADIFSANRLPLVTSANYELLFRMLADAQVQYFPRSVTEIWDELDEHRQYGFAVADKIAIHYPAALYYFVNKDNTKLADAVQAGLEKAVVDGSFDRLFHQYFDDVLKRADFEHRTILELPNPSLPKETPLGRRELWFQLHGKH